MVGVNTFVMVKPDACMRGLSNEIMDMFRGFGFQVFDTIDTFLGVSEAEALYIKHNNKPFFRDIVNNAISGPVTLVWLKSPNAVAVARILIGATDPAKREPGTLRAKYALSFRQNSVHGSDSDEAAERELRLFFSNVRFKKDLAKDPVIQSR